MADNPKPPLQPPSETATPSNNNLPRRSRPRVREVSSRFMSPSISTPKPLPVTPSLRRSQTDARPRFSDENRPDSLNRSSVSPVRSVKPRSAVKLFRSDTPVPTPGRVYRQPSWDTDASKLLRVNTRNNSSNNDISNSKFDDSNEDVSSIDGDCESIKSEPNNGGFVRVSTPCSRSMELNGSLNTNKGGGNEEKKAVKVARSLKLPPMAPSIGCGKSQGATEVKKAVKKGSGQLEDGHRLRLMHNHYLQWRFANAKAETCIINQKKQSERQLYSLGVKISDLRDSVMSKRIEYRFLKQTKTLSTILDGQMPSLDEWSTLQESYSSSLLELSNGLQNVLSRLPLVGNVRADTKEIEEALDSALKATEMICQQVQSFMPKAENVDCLTSDLARIYSGEIALVDECGDLLSRTRLSQVEECSLRGQLMQLHRCKPTRVNAELLTCSIHSPPVMIGSTRTI